MKEGESSEEELNLTIPRKAKFNTEDSDILQEETAYQKKISQSHDEEEEESSSASTVSETSKWEKETEFKNKIYKKNEECNDKKVINSENKYLIKNQMYLNKYPFFDNFSIDSLDYDNINLIRKKRQKYWTC